MLSPFIGDIGDIAILYAHMGHTADRGNRIYAVSAIRIDKRQEVTRFDALVRYARFSGRERYRSNLSKERLTTADPPEAVGPQLQAFLEGAGPVLFTLNSPDQFSELTAFCGNARFVDLTFAAEFFLPHLDSHSFKRLWEHLQGRPRETVHFRSTEVADLSVRLIRHITGTRLNDSDHPAAVSLRHYLVASGTLFGYAFVQICREYKKYFGGLFRPCNETDSGDWRRFLERADPVAPPAKPSTPYKPLTEEQVEQRFREMAGAGEGIAYRDTQVTYARSIAEAINRRAVLCLEAGTGTGKTRGYLLPVFEHLYRNPAARVAISTYTKSLQQQIFTREIEAVHTLFPHYREIPVAMLKGKSSYICAEKLGWHFEEEGVEGEAALAWLYCLNLVLNFRQADIDSIGAAVKRHLNRGGALGSLLNRISAREGCTPRHRHCPAQVVTAEARKARLVVTNHHKLALLNHDAILSGLFGTCVIDEANHFEQAIRKAYQQEADSRDLGATLGYVRETMAAILARSRGEERKEFSTALEGIETLSDQIRDLRKRLAAIDGIRGGEEAEIRPSHPIFREGHIKHHLTAMQNAVGRVTAPTELLQDDGATRRLKLVPRTVRKLADELDRVAAYGETLRTVQDSMDRDNHIAGCRVFRRSFCLTAGLVDVDELIRHHIYQDREAIIYTAATLRQKKRFDCFAGIVGMDRPFAPDRREPERVKPFLFKEIPSPFSPQAMEIIVPREARSGRYDNKEAWLTAVVALVPRLVLKNRGRSLVLFASYRDLEQVARRVAPRLADAMLPLLVQQPGHPTVTLCDEFRTVKESVLFGVDTFWYGVDFPGDTLTQVIITRIPYPSPADPLQVARKKSRPPDEYWKRYRYDSDLKMKQGMGRLIRCDTDRGRVVILDSRFSAATRTRLVG